jgi:signal peptidase I
VATIDRLDTLLRKIGGKIYPKTFWNDNIEVALVAAIIVIGIRTFFFQPFIIPTNSMFPTYSGMRAVVYEDKNDAPGTIERTFRFLTLGAKHKSLIAKSDGAVQLPMERTPMEPAVCPTSSKARNGSFFPLFWQNTRYLSAACHTRFVCQRILTCKVHCLRAFQMLIPS